MIKHIVLWKLKDTALGYGKSENRMLMKEKLESLRGAIPQLLALEVGIDFSNTESSADIVVSTEFATRQDLRDYQDHPQHKAVVQFITEVTRERRVVDYEAS